MTTADELFELCEGLPEFERRLIIDLAEALNEVCFITYDQRLTRGVVEFVIDYLHQYRQLHAKAWSPLVPITESNHRQPNPADLGG